VGVMGDGKLDFSKRAQLTVARRLEELPVINDIDEMLRNGMSSRDVAKFIQQGLEELEGVKFSSLRDCLNERRKNVLQVPPERYHAPVAQFPQTHREGRLPGQLARNQYHTERKGLDQMLELESLYLAQRDRLDTAIMKEHLEEELNDSTDRMMVAAAKLLEQHVKTEQVMLERMSGQGPSHEKLDLEGYSEETAQVLTKPDSRRRVISIVERLKRVRGGRQIPELPEASGE
jgi:hypothetical protein